jgi:hypothetical protein
MNENEQEQKNQSFHFSLFTVRKKIPSSSPGESCGNGNAPAARLALPQSEVTQAPNTSSSTFLFVLAFVVMKNFLGIFFSYRFFAPSPSDHPSSFLSSALASFLFYFSLALSLRHRCVLSFHGVHVCGLSALTTQMEFFAAAAVAASVFKLCRNSRERSMKLLKILSRARMNSPKCV